MDKAKAMKAKCEEIIIDQYLKGNISNEFKDTLLSGLHARRDNNKYLEIVFAVLKNDGEEKLRILETMGKAMRTQMLADNIYGQYQIPEEFVSKLIEELEHEPSE